MFSSTWRPIRWHARNGQTANSSRLCPLAASSDSQPGAGPRPDHSKPLCRNLVGAFEGFATIEELAVRAETLAEYIWLSHLPLHDRTRNGPLQPSRYAYTYAAKHHRHWRSRTPSVAPWHGRDAKVQVRKELVLCGREHDGRFCDSGRKRACTTPPIGRDRAR
jgi:hypothetical protein